MYARGKRRGWTAIHAQASQISHTPHIVAVADRVDVPSTRWKPGGCSIDPAHAWLCARIAEIAAELDRAAPAV
jgi:hypothetical protein